MQSDLFWFVTDFILNIKWANTYFKYWFKHFDIGNWNKMFRQLNIRFSSFLTVTSSRNLAVKLNSGRWTRHNYSSAGHTRILTMMRVMKVGTIVWSLHRSETKYYFQNTWLLTSWPLCGVPPKPTPSETDLSNFNYGSTRDLNLSMCFDQWAWI